MASNPSRAPKKAKSSKRKQGGCSQAVINRLDTWFIDESKKNDYKIICCKKCEGTQVFGLGMVLSAWVQLSQSVGSARVVKAGADERDMLSRATQGFPTLVDMLTLKVTSSLPLME